MPELENETPVVEGALELPMFAVVAEPVAEVVAEDPDPDASQEAAREDSALTNRDCADALALAQDATMLAAEAVGIAERMAQAKPKPAAHGLLHLAGKIFDTPLMIAPGKLRVVLAVVGSRLNLEAQPPAADAEAFARESQRKPYEVTTDGIAVIPIEGTLVNKAYGMDAWSGLRSYADIQEEVLDAATDPAIKGILLDVDSPGGEVAGAFDLADLIREARTAKPIYAVANSDAFSAAYLLASSASKVFMSRTSGVGSIGVIMTHIDESVADEKAGLKYTIITSGAHKADFNPHTPLTGDAQKVMEAEVNRVAEMFFVSVAKSRGISVEAIRKMQAGLFFGTSAIEAGLAYAIGTKTDALNAVREAVGITPLRAVFVPQARADAEPAAPALLAPLTDTMEQAREAATAKAAEILALCIKAGYPEEALVLFQKKATMEEVYARLTVLRSEASENQDNQIVSRHIPFSATEKEAETRSVKGGPMDLAVDRLIAGMNLEKK